MIVLGFDTATRSTAVALRLADGRTLQARDDPSPDERPGHATRLLGMTDELLADAGIGWSSLERISVGRGPGTFTGLRIGVATARGLAQSLGIELVGVSSLRALAESAWRTGQGRVRGLGLDGSHSAAHTGDPDVSDRSDQPIADGPPLAPGERPKAILAVLDARRGEAFVAAYLSTEGDAVEELIPPCALAPEELGNLVTQVEARLPCQPGEGGSLLAIGDGAMRFRGGARGSRGEGPGGRVAGTPAERRGDLRARRSRLRSGAHAGGPAGIRSPA